MVPIDLPQAEGQEVSTLCVGNNGDLRFAIYGGGFGSYDGKQFSPIGDARWWRPNIDANTVLEARDGALWTGCNRGVGRWVDGRTNDSFLMRV